MSSSVLSVSQTLCFGFALAFAASCSNRAKPKDEEPVKASNVKDARQVERVDGKSLSVVGIEASVETNPKGGGSILKLNAKPGPRGAFVEYSVCSGAGCMPPTEKPGILTGAKAREIPLQSTVALQIMLRGCTDRALDPNSPCGDWTKHDVKEAGAGRTGALNLTAVEKYETEEKMRESAFILADSITEVEESEGLSLTGTRDPGTNSNRYQLGEWILQADPDTLMESLARSGMAPEMIARTKQALEEIDNLRTHIRTLEQ